MDILTFITEIVKAIAWPIAAVIGLILFRSPLLKTMRELKRLKVKDIEVEFDKEVRQVQIKAQKVIPGKNAAPPGQMQKQQEIESRLLNLLEISPQAAVLDSWVEVEREMSSLLKRRAISLDTPRPTALQMADLLRRHELLADDGIWLFNALRELRNRAAHEHEEEITEDGARHYISMLTVLLDMLRAG